MSQGSAFEENALPERKICPFIFEEISAYFERFTKLVTVEVRSVSILAV